MDDQYYYLGFALASLLVVVHSRARGQKTATGLGSRPGHRQPAPHRRTAPAIKYVNLFHVYHNNLELVVVEIAFSSL
ncbi:unnamed protein product [Urochloa humidicola]